ncbi:hypothetical protein ACFLSS_02670 [Bacteroidota bacterium]
MKPEETTWNDWLKLEEELFFSSGSFINSINMLSPSIREQLIENSDWTPKDVLAHVVGWDIEVVKKFKEFIVNPDTDDEYDINKFNKYSVLKRRDNSFDEVMDEFNLAQSGLREITSSLTKNNIRLEPRFKEWVEVLIRHYDHHRIKLEKLIE